MIVCTGGIYYHIQYISYMVFIITFNISVIWCLLSHSIYQLYGVFGVGCFCLFYFLNVFCFVLFCFFREGNQSTRRKPPTCRKSLINVIIQSCNIEYTTTCCESNYHTEPWGEEVGTLYMVVAFCILKYDFLNSFCKWLRNLKLSLPCIY